jgi:hypothetical protein
MKVQVVLNNISYSLTPGPGLSAINQTYAFRRAGALNTRRGQVGLPNLDDAASNVARCTRRRAGLSPRPQVNRGQLVARYPRVSVQTIFFFCVHGSVKEEEKKNTVLLVIVSHQAKHFV